MVLMSPVADGVELRKISVGGIELDVYPKSGGIWFDNFELMRFDEAHEKGVEALYELPYDPDFKVDQASKRRSPRHPEIIMQRQIYGHKQMVEVDVCPMSGGIWLDRGELQAIRELYPDASEKEATEDRIAEQYIESHPMAQAIQADSAQTAKKAKAFARFFSWMRPSRYFL